MQAKSPTGATGRPELPPAYFVGFTSQVARMHYYAEPEAPANYENAEAIAKYKAKVRKRRLEEGQTCPVIASITACQVFDQRGQVAFQFTTTTSDDVRVEAAKFWLWLASVIKETSDPTYFCGFRIRTFMQIIAAECLAARGASVPVPIRVWRDGYGLVDPYERVLDEDTRKHIDLAGAIQFFTNKTVEEKILFQDPRLQAMLAHEMTVRTQLLVP